VSRRLRLTAAMIRCADHMEPSTHGVNTNFADRSIHSVSIVRLRTNSHRVCLVLFIKKKISFPEWCDIEIEACKDRHGSLSSMNQ
jgi:hypothetical protein